MTKSDWNRSVFSGKDAITTAFSEDMGQILAEMNEEAQPRTTYRFYM
ncbi:MAG: hypothetical protein V4550_08230 [Gemmatimonadota bacterium]